MLRLSHRGLIAVGGGLWVAVGLLLGGIGIKLLWGDGRLVALALAAAAVTAGAIKGGWLRGIAERNVRRIRALPNASGVWRLYRARGWVFVAGMMGLGMALRRASASAPGLWGNTALGTVDLAVGVALLMGARRYHRALIAPAT